MFLLKFLSGELVRCIIKFHIQRVPTRHTFDGPCYPKNKKYMEKRDDDMGSRWMRNLIPHPTSSLDRNLSKNTWRYVENTNKKVVFFMIPIPKFMLKNCLRPIQYLKFKSISLANT